MFVVKIYRKKTSNPFRKPTSAVVNAVLSVLAIKARIRRPGVEALFFGGSFALLPSLTTGQIDAAADRSLSYPDAGVVVALADLGRVGSKCDAAGRFSNYEDARSCAQSILLWIKKNLGDVVDASEVSVVVEQVF
jgi:hypothetical protein